MDNYEAIAYAVVALRDMKEAGVEMTENKFANYMLDLMDRFSEIEIYEKYNEKYYK